MIILKSWLLIVAVISILNPPFIIAQEDSRYLGKWTGFWTQSEWRGTAALTVRRDQAGLAADFVLAGTGAGTKSFTLPASVEDGALVMKTQRSITRLNLVGGDTLSGVYEITTGRFEGEMGNYSLKRR